MNKFALHTMGHFLLLKMFYSIMQGWPQWFHEHNDCMVRQFHGKSHWGTENAMVLNLIMQRWLWWFHVRGENAMVLSLIMQRWLWWFRVRGENAMVLNLIMHRWLWWFHVRGENARVLWTILTMQSTRGDFNAFLDKVSMSEWECYGAFISKIVKSKHVRGESGTGLWTFLTKQRRLL